MQNFRKSPSMQVVAAVRDSAQPNSCKYLLSMDHDSVVVEFVFLDFETDRVLCASAQSGCAVGCVHCATSYALRPFIRNLTTVEIVEAVRHVIRECMEGRQLDVLDFSGVGDCSKNWTAVRNACEQLKRNREIGRYTVSSIAPRRWCEALVQELRDGTASLQRVMISLHGVDAATRRLLIPGAEDPRIAVQWWRPLYRAGCRVLLNYVVHANNCSERHMQQLAEFVNQNHAWIAGLRISPLNPVPGGTLQAGDDMDQFVNGLRKLVVRANIQEFTPIGSRCGMACGQLRAMYQSDRI